MKTKPVELRWFQSHLREIYDKGNHRYFTNNDLLAHLLRYVTRASKAVRNNRLKKVEENLVIGFAWAIAISNRYHIDIVSEIHRRFPGVCPYCYCAPCSCGPKRADKRQIVSSRTFGPWSSISAGQNMFAKIYPRNTASDSAGHLCEEVGEVGEAILFYSGRHTNAGFKEVRVELTDVFANMFGLATCAHIPMEEVLFLKFQHGCPWCNKLPCRCSFNGIVKSTS